MLSELSERVFSELWNEIPVQCVPDKPAIGGFYLLSQVALGSWKALVAGIRRKRDALVGRKGEKNAGSPGS